jgi:hypothetical protein
VKEVALIVVGLPALALSVGAGVLAWRIGDSWGEAQTASLLTSASMICGGGMLLTAILVALIVGVPMASRFFHEAGVSRQTWDAPPPGYHALPGGYREPRPPQLVDGQAGAFRTIDPQAYDLWEAADTVDARIVGDP